MEEGVRGQRCGRAGVVDGEERGELGLEGGFVVSHGAFVYLTFVVLTRLVLPFFLSPGYDDDDSLRLESIRSFFPFGVDFS